MAEKAELSEDQKSRIHLLKMDHWIGYDRAIAVRDEMDALIDHPRTHRMPCLAVIGHTNNGKTTVLRSFLKRHEINEDPNAEKTEVPVFYLLTPPTADEGRLYYEMLDRLSATGPRKEREDSKLSRLKLILRRLNTRAILLDDFFNAGSGSVSKQRVFLNAIRNLSNDLEMPIIISGTPESLNILSVDPSIENRFKPAFLPKWNKDRIEELERFLVSIERFLHLKSESDLLSAQSIDSLLTFSEGLLGEMVAILRLAAEHAIRTGKEAIDASMLSKNSLKTLGWVAPSERSRHRE